MSFNITVVTPTMAICVTDRRLSSAGKILTERSTKLTAFQCANAHGFITYNGIGTDRLGATPSDWLSEMHSLGNLQFQAFVDTIKADADRRINDERHFGRSDTRHTFVISGYLGLKPFILALSNYERADTEATLSSAKPELEVTWRTLRVPSIVPNSFLLLASGANPARKNKMRDRIVDRIKNRAKPEAVRSAMVKAVRDVAYQHGRAATVGTSCQSGMTDPFGGFEINGHVPGGTALMEGPNLIRPGSVIRDLSFYSGNRVARSRYDSRTQRAVIPEFPCSTCGAPIPEGYRKCGVCDAQI